MRREFSTGKEPESIRLCRKLAGDAQQAPAGGCADEIPMPWETARAEGRDGSIAAMCFDPDSHPPIPPIAGAAVDGKRITLRSADGTEFAAFAARAANPSGAGMLILPDVRGLYTFYEELTLRFAEAGISALAIDYFGRTAGTDPRPTDFDHSPHVNQTEWNNLRADMHAASGELAAWPEVARIFSVGFCFGGRLSLLLASEPDFNLAGCLSFYGWPAGENRGLPQPIDTAKDAKTPILALFGGQDHGIPQSVVDQYRTVLESAGADHEVVVYPNAGHSFFDRKAAENAADSADAWQRVQEFVAQKSA
jgi:carboxymethylenebutenolidase